MARPSEIVQRYFELWNERKLELADQLFEPDFVGEPLAYDAPWEGRGPESVKHYVLSWLLGMPDLQLREVHHVGQGSTIASQWEMVGVHKGVLFGIAPTGLPLRAQGVTWFELGEGRIKQMRISFDSLGFLQQLGVLPDSAGILEGIANASRP